MVAPPRGERGLKHCMNLPLMKERDGRSPSWGAWIETYKETIMGDFIVSLPLVGSVD